MGRKYPRPDSPLACASTRRRRVLWRISPATHDFSFYRSSSATRRSIVNRRMTVALLVVLALCLSMPAGSAVQVGLADTDNEVTGVLHKDTGGGLNGDDDRWGDASPVNGDPDEPDPGEEEGAGDGNHDTDRARAELHGFSGFRFFVRIMYLMTFAR
jgi:hypothetical protein